MLERYINYVHINVVGLKFQILGTLSVFAPISYDTLPRSFDFVITTYT